jgi:choline-glycine betaine transporter
MPPGLLSAILYLPLTAIFLIPFIRSQLWHVVLLVILLPLIYAAAYLAVFYRHTGLTQATRREVILLARRTLTVATVVYIVLTLGDQTALIAALAVTVALVLVGLVIRRADANAIQELQAHRHTWAGILSMSSRDALLMRIPDTRLHKAQ